MLLVLEDQHKKHLQFLTDVELSVLSDFCRISMKSLMRGSVAAEANAKIYESAAKKLGASREQVQSAVEGLAYLFVEAARHKISDVDFLDSVLTAGFPEAHRKELLEQFRGLEADVGAILQEMSMSSATPLPQQDEYRDLEWRCDVKLASRSLRHQVTPLTTLRLRTSDGDNEKVTCMQVDLPTLVRLTESLDQALQETKSRHGQRIARTFK